MAGTTYPGQFVDQSGQERFLGSIVFTSDTNQPSNNSNLITSGTLPQLSAWVSTTAQQNPVSRPITVVVEVADDGTNNAGSCAIAISPNDSDYTTLGTVTIPAGLNNLGAMKQVIPVPLPLAWWIKLTFTATRIVVAQSYYY